MQMLLALTFIFAIYPSRAKAEWQSSSVFEFTARQYGLPQSASTGGSSGTSTSGLSETNPNTSALLSAGLNLDWKSENNDSIRFRSDLEMASDFFAKNAPERFLAQAKNFYFQLPISSAKGLRSRWGLQTLNFEGPDFLNPMDVIHAKNWIDPTLPKNLSSAGVLISQDLETWQWDLFYVPTQTVSVLPGIESVWWPREKRLPIESADVEVRLPANVKYKIADFNELNQARSNNLAFHIQQKSQNFESQFLFFEGLSQDVFLLLDSQFTLIASSPKQILLANSPLTLKPLYFRQQVAALNFVLPVSQWLIKGGAQYKQPMGNSTSLPSVNSTYVLGTERTFDSPLGGITLVAQYQTQKKFDKTQVSFLRSIFENAFSFGFRVPYGDDTQFLGGLIYDLSGFSSAFSLTANHRLNDSWGLTGDLQLLQGPDSTLLGLYSSYDHLGVGFTYHY